MTWIGIAHLVFALLALLSGTVVIFRRKGTVSHKRFGYFYVACLLALNLTALMIYRLLGVLGPFHVLALVSIATLFAGLVPALRRTPGWLDRHYRAMSWSYVGLCAAFVAEILVRTPLVRGIGWGFGIAVLAGSSAVALVGGVIIRRRRRSVMMA